MCIHAFALKSETKQFISPIIRIQRRRWRCTEKKQTHEEVELNHAGPCSAHKQCCKALFNSEEWNFMPWNFKNPFVSAET